MKRFLEIISIVLLSSGFCFGEKTAGQVNEGKLRRAEVVIIGTIHSRHYENSNYSPEKLKEIILSLKPDVILNELPLSLVESDGRPLERIRSKDNTSGPESWVADTVAQQLGIKQIPFDRPDRQENFRKTKYFEKQSKSAELKKIMGEHIERIAPNSNYIKMVQLQGYASQAEASLFLNAKPDVMNSEAHDSIIRIKKSLWYDLVPRIMVKYPGFKEVVALDHFFRDEWNVRNTIMVENIVKAANEYPGKRLVVITGATHRYILRDLLKDNPHVELKEYWEIIGRN